MHIIITRPIEDSLFLIERLKKQGHMVTHLPIIKIQELKTEKINFKNYKAVIFTSSNSIKFLNINKFGCSFFKRFTYKNDRWIMC